MYVFMINVNVRCTYVYTILHICYLRPHTGHVIIKACKLYMYACMHTCRHSTINIISDGFQMAGVLNELSSQCISSVRFHLVNVRRRI